MGLAVISDNTTLKVNRAISSSTTVNPNCYAVVDYVYSSDDAGTGFTNQLIPHSVTRNFGSGQSVPASVSVIYKDGATTYTITYAISTGYELINSP